MSGHHPWPPPSLRGPGYGERRFAFNACAVYWRDRVRLIWQLLRGGTVYRIVRVKEPEPQQTLYGFPVEVDSSLKPGEIRIRP